MLLLCSISCSDENFSNQALEMDWAKPCRFSNSSTGNGIIYGTVGRSFVGTVVKIGDRPRFK